MAKNELTDVYHERQLRELCALHALNNLFQGMFTKHQLDEICKQLSPDNLINPHKSVLGLGNYDINVIMTALQRIDCEANWFDKRKDPLCINYNKIIGFIFNVPTDYKIGFIVFPFKKRHWVAVRKINNSYYNLDSKLESPICIGNEEDLISYLRNQLQCKNRELFVVVKNENAQKWLRKSDLS